MAKKEVKIDTLEQIKRLIVLAMVHQGISGKDIASAMGVDPATVSRMTPPKFVKKK